MSKAVQPGVVAGVAAAVILVIVLVGWSIFKPKPDQMTEQDVTSTQQTIEQQYRQQYGGNKMPTAPR